MPPTSGESDDADKESSSELTARDAPGVDASAYGSTVKPFKKSRFPVSGFRDGGGTCAGDPPAAPHRRSGEHSLKDACGSVEASSQEMVRDDRGASNSR